VNIQFYIGISGTIKSVRISIVFTYKKF